MEGFRAQMGDAVTLQVLCPCEGFPTTLLCTDKTTVIIVFPDKDGKQILSVLKVPLH